MAEFDFGQPPPPPHRTLHEIGGSDAIRAVIAARRLVLPLFNASGGTVIRGSCVALLEASAARSFTTSTTAGDPRVFGVLLEDAKSTGPAQVAFTGYVEQVRVATGTTKFQFLEQSGTAGVAQGSTSRTSGTFGVALESRNATTGTVPAFLFGSTAAVPWINVVDYGADPTGVANSGAAINLAIAAAAATGVRHVFAPAGTYILEVPIVLQSDTWLSGAGWQATFFKIKGSNTNINAIDTQDNVYRAMATDFCIDCNKANNNANGIAIKGWYDHSIFTRVWVRNCEREAFYLCPGDGYAETAPGVSAITITNISVANPTVVTTATAHGLITGQKVILSGSNSTPTINGTRTATVTDSTHFTVDVNVTVQGTTGTSTESYPSQSCYDTWIYGVEVEDSDISFRYTSQFTDGWIGPRCNVAAATANLYCTSQGSPILVENNWFNGNPVNNIHYPASGTNLFFKGNIIENSQQHSILIIEPSYLLADHEARVNITGNLLKNANSSAGAYDAIHIEGYDATHRLVGVTITGNSFINDVNTPRYGVYLDDVVGVTVVGNDMDSFGTQTFKTAGSAVDVILRDNSGSDLVEEKAQMTVEADLSADVTMTNADTYYDGPSVSLGKGLWHITGTVTVLPTQAGGITAKLWDGTTVESSAEMYQGSGGQVGCVTVSGIVLLTSTTTYKISAARSNAAGSGTIRAAAQENGAGNNASHIRAVRIA